MKKKLPIALIGAFLAGNATAACKQSDARGTWITYQAAFITASGGQHVGECRLKVNRDGSLTKEESNNGGSYCEFVTFNTGHIPTEGTFTLNRNCSATISLSIGLEAQAQVSANKQMYAGRFTAQGGSVSGTTTAVRQ